MARNEASLEIEAAPERLFELLRGEAQGGVERGAARIIEERRGRELAVDVGFGWAMTVRQTYRLERAGRGRTLVTASIAPRGARWHLTNVLLLGRGMTALRNAAETGLHNLKRTAEGAEGAEADEEDGEKRYSP